MRTLTDLWTDLLGRGFSLSRAAELAREPQGSGDERESAKVSFACVNPYTSYIYFAVGDDSLVIIVSEKSSSIIEDNMRTMEVKYYSGSMLSRRCVCNTQSIAVMSKTTMESWPNY